MSFTFTRGLGTGIVSRRERAFEMVPAATSWLIIIGMLVLTIYPAGSLGARHHRLRVLLARAHALLEHPPRRFVHEAAGGEGHRLVAAPARHDRHHRVCGEPPHGALQKNFYVRLSHRAHRREIGELIASHVSVPSWDEIRHVVIIPIAREKRVIFEPGIKASAMVVILPTESWSILAVEERGGPEVKRDALAVRRKYRGELPRPARHSASRRHPRGGTRQGSQRDLRGKGGHGVVARRAMAIDNVIVSCFDADTVVSPTTSPASPITSSSAPTGPRRASSPSPSIRTTSGRRRHLRASSTSAPPSASSRSPPTPRRSSPSPATA